MPSIDAIEGIGPKFATRLRKSGIRTTEGLLKRGRSKKGRSELAAKTGLTYKIILEWVNLADLMRVKGIGSEYSDLLEAAGVDTVKELRRRSSASLTAKLAQVNEQKKLVRRLPTEGMVAQWIEQAKTLDSLVTY